MPRYDVHSHLLTPAVRYSKGNGLEVSAAILPFGEFDLLFSVAESFRAALNSAHPCWIVWMTRKEAEDAGLFVRDSVRRAASS